MSEKTENPTPKRLREAREKGQVAKSQEVCSSAVIVTVMAVFGLRFDANMEELRALYDFLLTAMHHPFHEAVAEVGGAALGAFLFIAGPIIIIAPLAGIAAYLSQVGVLFAFKGAMPSLNKLSPKQWVDKVFSKKAMVELGKTIIKVVVLAWILKGVVIDNIDPILKAGLTSPETFLSVFGGVMFDIFLWCTLVFGAVGAVDFLIQKHLFTKQMMMSKDEVKREYKEMEGDPQIRSRRKQMHQEMVLNDTMQQTRKASVLVTNPTRIAIALFYEEGKTPLPLVTAMGQGAIAKKMREIAEEEGIPIMENVPLARELLETGEVHNYIPSNLVQPVAEVMRWVNDLTDR
ncbi:MAG: type III secretion system export apparatus subunit SctU [Deltaproteobacteria bacterium]|jgi:type III secretion protein U|nr:type III secretion system export apparatus subunit SctU [Deltaproteobacteria bacterium]